MKVLVSDNLGEIGIEMLKNEPSIETDVKVGLSKEELKNIIGNYNALIIRSETKVTEDILECAKNLKVIGRAGIGLDNVDIKAASKRGIVVMNTPEGNIVTTAEHAISLLMALSRKIPQATQSLKSGLWEKKKFKGQEVFDKIIGVIGFGKIGSIVADRAKGLKMQVIIYDPYVMPEKIEKAGFEAVSLDELFAKADYITVHVPKLKDTTNILNKANFDKMKTGVMIINCARGGIVNEEDLYQAIKSGKVKGAALDVFETEPPGNNKLFELDNFICTPHLGASSQEAQTNVAMQIASQIIDYLKNGTVINAVNAPSVKGELLEKLNPYLSLADKMGCLQAQISKKPIKEVIIEYNGDFGGLDLTPVSTAAIKGLLTPIVTDSVNFVNAQIIAKERGIKVTETSNPDAKDYINLITIKTVMQDKINTVSGTIFGKKDLRVVQINNFRLEMVPQGHAALIHNDDKPGAIGSIGTMLGKYNVNIGRMSVGQEEDGARNIIMLKTDTPIPPEVAAEIQALPLIKSITLLEL